jgi:hypothetical protein
MPFGLVLRIWDNLFAYGSRYLFQVAIAILTLLEDTLLERDMEQINTLFGSFRDNTKAGNIMGNNDAYFLPPDEDIIKMAGKINFNHAGLDTLRREWKELNPKMKEGKDIKSEVKTDVRNRATVMRRLEHMKEDINIKVEDINKSDEDNIDRQEDQQARSSDIHHIGGSSGGPNMDLSSGG